MISGFGDRLRSARKEAGLSVPYMVDHINTYLTSYGFKTIHESTYYSWEKIGTAREVKTGKSFPHPAIYPLLLEKFGITGYWLFLGEQGGRIVRYADDLPNQFAADIAKQQIYSLSDKDPLHEEIDRVKSSLTPLQRSMLLSFLRTIK